MGPIPIKIGSHRVFIEGDLLILVVKGPMTIEDVVEYHRTAEQIFAEQGRLFILADISGATTPPPKSRHLLAEWTKSQKISGVAISGGSMAMTALAMLILRAIRLVHHAAFPLTFAKTEKDARVWVIEQRSRISG